MKTKPYRLLDVWPADYGDTVKIALCDDFNQAMRAKKDGCDAALILNARTKKWYRRMTECLPDGTAEQLRAAQNPFKKLWGLWLRDRLNRVTAQMAVYVRKSKSQRIQFKEIRPCPNIHLDMPSAREYEGLITTIPTTIGCTKKPITVWSEGAPYPAFKVGPGDNDICAFMQADIHTSPQFSLLPGTMLLMFREAGKQCQLAHSEPSSDPRREDYMPVMRCRAFV